MVRPETGALDALRVLTTAGLPGLIVHDGESYLIVPASQVLRVPLPRFVLDEPSLARVWDEASADVLAARLVDVQVSDLVAALALGELLAGVTAFEVGTVAATLLILRAQEQVAPEHGKEAAVQIALLLNTGYNLAATRASVPAGRVADRLGAAGPVRVLLAGVLAFAAAYLALAAPSTSWGLLLIPFLAAGVAIGCVETAEHAAVAALAPSDLRGSAFGLLAGVQSLGNVAASAVAGILWTAVSPSAAFGYLTAWMLIAAVLLAVAAHRSR